MGQQKKSKHIGRTVLIVLLALVLFGVYTIFAVKNFNKAFDASSDEHITVIIPSGASTTKIAYILEDNNLIKSADLFKYKTKLNSLDGTYQAGEYILSPSMTMEEIMKTLQHAIAKQVKITIKEGWTMKQIADYLVENSFISSKSDFYSACEDDYDYEFLPKEGNKINDEISAKANRVEGYLYPNTYYINEGSNAHTIINTLLNEFNKKVYLVYKDKTPKDFSFRDLITFASMVEKECGVDEERARISGVFWNRLDINMKLESNATTEYITGKYDGSYNGPYSTYHHYGLPAGPICTPTIKSIEATLNPEDHNYLFFVLKGDGSHTSFFAETYEEHEKNIAIWKSNPYDY